VKKYPPTAWVVIYEHHHGVSITLWNDGKAAAIAVANMMKRSRYWQDVPKKLIPLFSKVGKRSLDAWADMTGGAEKFHIRLKPLLNMEHAKLI